MIPSIRRAASWLLLGLSCAPPTHEAIGVGVSADAETLIHDLNAQEGGESSTLVERMRHYGVPGLSVALLRDGEVAWARGFGVTQAGTQDLVDSETVFSVGSVSKVAAAATTLRIADADQLDIDEDVERYLRSWSIPKTPHTDRSPVTLRRLMSHTAGTTVHGFADFQPGEELPTTVQILEGSGPAKNPPVVVIAEPGTLWQYSGGGTTIEQLVIEDVTGLPLARAAGAWVFEPLGMTRSTFLNPLPAEHGNIACAHDERGYPTALPRGWEAMPESAASGLWTSPTDLARLLIALRDAWLGKPGAFLSTDLAQDLMTEVAPGNYGLGPELAGSGSTRRFLHGGSNDSYQAFFVMYLESGDGAIVFANGRDGEGLIDEVIAALGGSEEWPITEGS